MAGHHARLRPSHSQVKTLFLFSLMMFTVLQDVYGFDCDLTGGSKSVFDKINVLTPKSCPSLISSDDQMFCCQTEETAGITLNYCCDLKAFLQMKWVIFTMVGIAVGLVLGCCLCGCCCYRRRTRGAVYGRVQTIVLQQPAAVQVPPASSYPAYGSVPGVVQQPPIHGYQPPPYSANVTTEVYAKQAAYNPHQY